MARGFSRFSWRIRKPYGLYRKSTRLSPGPVGIIRVTCHQACRFAPEMAGIVLLRQELARGFGMRQVFVLGSGFSRAISNGLSEADKMPTLTGLSEAVLANLDRKGQGLLPGRETPVANDFEQWLNYLIESPPWLTPSEQHRNQAAFFEVSQALRDVLLKRQTATVRCTQSTPGWLAQLVNHWDKVGATVITFNYDQLVELAWRVHVAGQDDTTDLYPVPIAAVETRAGGAREASKGLFRSGRTSRSGMQLLKLHGSLGWYYSGVDGPPNDSIYDLGIKGPKWDVHGLLPVDPGHAELLTADLQPMIVPPAAIKSPYYANRTLQALWRIAAKAIRGADELVIMGFSLPQSDSLVGSLLSTNFLLTEHCTILPVDFDDLILSRLHATFGLAEDDDRLITSYTNLNDTAIPQWVGTFANAVEV